MTFADHLESKLAVTQASSGLPSLAFGRCSVSLQDWHRRVREIIHSVPDSQQFELIRQLSDRSLFFFLVYVLGWTFLDNDFAYNLCQAVQKRKYGQLWVLAREHYKSTVITIGSTIWEMVRDSTKTYVIYSYKDPAAHDLFYSPIKTTFEKCSDLKVLYPESCWDDPRREADVWLEDCLNLKGHADGRKEHSLEHASILAQKTGSHFDRGLYDDCMTLEACVTTDSIRKVIDAYSMSLNTLAEGSRKVVIGTFYHHAELYADIMDKGLMKPVIQPCVDPSGRPVRFTAQQLRDKKIEMGRAVYATQMMCDPKAGEAMGFKREWLNFWGCGITDGLNIYILVDPARKVGEKTDFTTFWVIGVDAASNYLCLDIVRDKLSLSGRTDILFSLHQRYNPITTYYETNGTSDLEHMIGEQDARNYHFPIVGLNQWINKLQRIEALEPLFTKRKIFLPEYGHCVRTNWEGRQEDMVRTFVDQEYLAYPSMGHDDAFDCLGNILHPSVRLSPPDRESQEQVIIEKMKERGMRFDEPEDEYRSY